jgi:5-(carboxyamino)imidazole ribonucleotide synthase
VLEVIQDRGVQKRWLVQHKFPLGAYEDATSEAELTSAVRRLGSSFAKTCTGGYDGGGQARLSRPEDAPGAWKELGSRALVVEKALNLKAELSVLVARSSQGEVAIYPPALNHHVNRILEWSALPGPIPKEVAEQATKIAARIAEELKVEGLLVVELFLTEEGELLVNELAPRPHNSFHATEVGAVTSQFEQLVRAVCGLPLGSTEVIRPAAIANLLGDLWLDGKTPPFDRALALPGVSLHLYGKRVARPGRKMGHLAALGRTPEEAAQRVLEAKRLLER